MSIYQNIVDRSPINKGWSGDHKYCVTTTDGQKYLLRISSIDRLERKRREYEKMSEVAELGIPMCLPIEFAPVRKVLTPSRAGSMVKMQKALLSS